MEVQMENSCLEGDSNALVLPAKKRNKRKGINQENEGVQKKKNPKLSKSQERKLKKLEEKEKAFLLAKSIETLEKYKIPEDAFSLLRSSRNISRVETVREKRRMAVQFSKAGLEVSHGDQPFKMCTDGASCKIEVESKSINWLNMNKNDHLQPMVRETEVDASDSLAISQELVSYCKQLNSNSGSVSGFSSEEVPSEEDSIGFSPTSCCHDTRKTSHLMVKSDESSIAALGGTRNVLKCYFQSPIASPTVVHVVRPNAVEEQRKDLPIVMMEQEIMEAINGHSTVIICGETGCGKTTQVPQFLYEAGFGSKQSVARGGIIGVTQPRRVAVLATARRVAYELGLHLGKEVGFQVRHDKRIGDSCTIKFMTDGILLREAQNDFLLKRYSVIILDEAHERSVNTDILIGMLCRAIPLRQKIYEDQQQMLLSGQSINPENMVFPLKLVLMSATLRVEDFVSGRRLFHNPPVIEVPTRQFPVTVHFSKRTEIVDYIGQAYKKVLSIHKRLPQGGILVFVTGQREVEFLCQKLRKASKKLIANTAEGNIRNEASATPEMSSIEEINMKDINEAFEIQGNSTNEQTDRFSSYEKELPYPNEDESDVSYNSETESEIEIVGDDGDSGDQSISENDGNLLGVLGEGSLTALRAAFEVLAGKNASDPNSEGKHNPSMPEDLLEQSNHIVAKKNGGDKSVSVGALCVLPLYAMLPAAAQLRVFEGVKEEERLVVVATNVAETSLTIPGIKYVVDTGREKVKNYNPSNGMETYEIQWISKASAAQRAGRAGRTGPGHCYRLYSSAVFNNIFPDFSCAEISKVPVDSIVLVLKSMSINKVANFPFPTPPEATALVEAEKCLKTLEALDDSGRLTPLGKAMANFPMSPRHSRMLLTVIQIMRKVKNYARANLVLGYAVAAAAALSLTNPFLMEFVGSHDNSNGLEQDGISDSLGNEINLDKQEKLRRKKLKEMAKLSRAKFSNPTSDAMTIAYALQCFELSNNPVEFCTENALHLKTMEEMSKLRKQLLQLVFNQNVNHGFDQEFSWIHGTVGDVEQAWRVSFSKNPLLLNEEELLGQAICAGWADRVAKRIRGDSKSSEGDRKVNSVRYEACGVKEIVFLHRWSSLSNSAPEFLVYSELLRTKRPYIHGATSVKSEWLVKYARSLCSVSTVEDPKPFYDPQTDQVYCWISPTFMPRLWQLPLYSAPVGNDVERVRVFAYALLEGHVLPCFRSVRNFMAARPSIILDREAVGGRRVGNLLFKLEAKLIDSCAMLREVWKENPDELHLEILHWFKKSFHNHFGTLWSQMHVEVQLGPHERFPKKMKDKRKEH
ncbi:ATP-dependent RNA helicase DEAH13 isoform X2 [Hevea brasiliensis]|uniref:ATP-dependent RNA helicase DEAH13 isoform X2 n=1 Tax=Hevea brasiliensis TaxID=3981 RepID=UPI0025F6E504|nr:ATP-dependent RNA helicase DEAH13 isoform X2 [Hevea brasiliensis]